MPSKKEYISMPHPNLVYKHNEVEIMQFVKYAVAMDIAREALGRIHLRLESEPPAEIPEYSAYQDLSHGTSSRQVHVLNPTFVYSTTHDIYDRTQGQPDAPIVALRPTGSER